MECVDLYFVLLAVFGGLDLHGEQRSPVQTVLAMTAEAGATEITVRTDIDWKVSLLTYTNFVG